MFPTSANQRAAELQVNSSSAGRGEETELAALSCSNPADQLELAVFAGLSNTALQAALRFACFLRMQAVMRSTLGISEAHSLNASGVQAARCSAVAFWAKLGVANDVTATARMRA
jgi:hypothetical protein